MQRVFVTGAAGFIGSNFVDRLLAMGCHVVGYDNFSTGQREFLAAAAGNPQFQLVEADVLDLDKLQQAMAGCDSVMHLAANADVRLGPQRTRIDLEQNIIATWNVLEALRLNKIKQITFASTGSIYGEADVIPTPENAPIPIQTSLYGASKLAAEGMIEAYSEAFGIKTFIFRFVSILGERYTHGHVVDFCRQLLEHPNHLDVLGDGHQKKSYLYIQDCLDAILATMDLCEDRVNIFNLGTDEYCEVNDSIGWICKHLGVSPEITYSGGNRGWIGDNPFIFLDCKKVRSLGWEPKLSIQEGIVRTIEFLLEHQWVLERQ